MHSIRTILFHTFLGGIVLTPFFAFAQTTTPALTAAQIQQQQQLQQQLDQLRSEQMAAINANPTQVSASLILQNLDIKVSPQNPGPDEAITVTIESYISDLDKATFSWSLNGKVVQSGVGKRSLGFVNGPSGKTTNLTVNITTVEGINITKRLSWSPVGLTILWEANTYTPPFYRGKALLAPQAEVRVVALPDSTSGSNALSADNFAYVWQKDGSVVTSASGYKKNYFTFPAPMPFGQTNVKVSVSSMDGSVSSEKTISPTLTQPFVLFYEDSPLIGVWYNHAIGNNFTLTQKEFSIKAAPYFFSTVDTNDSAVLKYDWSVNGNPAQNFGQTITLRNDAGTQGNSNITLSISGLQKIFQDAVQSLTVHFNNSDTANSSASF